MILTSTDIASRDIVQGAVPAGARDTTYDATVGAILRDGITHEEPSYVLPARGMVWVVSKEIFSLPDDITGLATLRTTWTHNGILALNVGVVDPGWNGPLATAVVNFSNTNFKIKKGETFLRVLFIEHGHTSSPKKRIDAQAYLAQIRDKSAITPNTFLNLKSLADEVVTSLSSSSMVANRLAKIGVIVGFGVLLVALVAIFVPIAYGVSSEFLSRKADVQTIAEQIADLQKKQEADQRKIISLEFLLRVR